MTTTPTTLQLTHTTQSWLHPTTPPLDSWFVSAMEAIGARCTVKASGRVDHGAASALLDASDEVIAFNAGDADQSTDSVVVRRGDCVAFLTPGRDGTASLVVSGRTPDTARAALLQLRALLEPAPTIGGAIEVRMWHRASPAHFESHLRRIDSRPIEETDLGITSVARAALQRIRAIRPQGGVHVWHGPPGCGKTTAIRSLALAWADHTTIEVVLDASMFLGDPSYMLHVLKARPARPARRAFDLDGTVDDDAPRVIVLEDAGEVLSPDASARVGNGLSRLLNLTDGMFGDRSRPCLFITTNEPVRRLHPALVRPGRCRSIIEFGPLTVPEARAWLDARGCDSDIDGPVTIAELAELVGDVELDGAVTAGAPIGFA